VPETFDAVVLNNVNAPNLGSRRQKILDDLTQFLLATEVLPVNTRRAGSVIMPVFR